MDTDVLSVMAAYFGYRRQCYGGLLWIQTSVLWRHILDTDVSVMAAYCQYRRQCYGDILSVQTLSASWQHMPP